MSGGAGAGVTHAILESEGLTKEFPVGGWLRRRRRFVHALTDVSIAIAKGETVAVVGESGCGKSTLGRCLIRLTEPTAGTVRLHGEDVAGMVAAEPLRFRRAVQIVFQDPYASLNPRRTIAQSLDDPLRIHGAGTAAERQARAEQLMEQVGLARELLGRYPHELSGGQRQRVAIARALAPGPEVIVCDEAVSSLDVSIQAQIINLLRDIQARTGIAYLFITHNLHLVHRIADRILVMYLGQIVEAGEAAAMRARLIHPYSSALFAAAPRVNRSGRTSTRRAASMAGEVPSPIDPPAGCRFHTRCPLVQPICTQRAPALEESAGRRVRCHFAADIAAGRMAVGVAG
ncbi:MAG: ATP-binding cassette domain-containing protein [Alphaproteobacteria bacterium]|nr:ATP-binding cassette domain-containing protein [Alphaproteobacteria bacterium]